MKSLKDIYLDYSINYIMMILLHRSLEMFCTPIIATSHMKRRS